MSLVAEKIGTLNNSLNKFIRIEYHIIPHFFCCLIQKETFTNCDSYILIFLDKTARKNCGIKEYCKC